MDTLSGKPRSASAGAAGAPRVAPEKRSIAKGPRGQHTAAAAYTARGITVPLTAIYWPRYRWRAPQASSGERWGCERGRAADAAVSAWCCGRMPESRTARRDLQVILNVLSRIRLRLVSTQASTGGHKLATRADIVARDHSGGTVLVEQKVGFRGGAWMQATARMQHELRDWTDCPRNQALVQLAVTVALWERHRGPVRDAYVIQVCETGGRFHRLPATLRALGPKLLLRLETFYIS